MDDTISAIATPIGEGALAIIRMSGPRALDIAARLFRHKAAPSKVIKPEELEPRHTYFGILVDQSEILDEVVLTAYRSPKSYTGEDLVEITCHGGISVCNRILTATLQYGCRGARSGEFTRRSFLNGKMDLAQCEAVAELIKADSDSWRRAAIDQLGGNLSSLVNSVRRDLNDSLSLLESSIDFPDETAVEDPCQAVSTRLSAITITIADLISRKKSSIFHRDGVKVAVAGVPNSGKSTLFNALVGRNRSIVSAEPGTTRDTIDEMFQVDGIAFRLTDTAGIRQSNNDIERQGIERAVEACERSDVVMAVLDPTQDNLERQSSLALQLGVRNIVWVLSKSDCWGQQDQIVDLPGAAFKVSATKGTGLRELRAGLSNVVRSLHPNCGSDGRILFNSRHIAELEMCNSHLHQALIGIEAGHPCDVVASNVRLATNSLSEIIGEGVSDEIADSVFSTFCIGK